MAGKDLDFKMRLEAQTTKFSQNIGAALKQLQALNRAMRDLDKSGKGDDKGLRAMRRQAEEVRDALRDAAGSARAIGQTARAASNVGQAERAAVQEAKRAAKEREKAERDLSRALAAEAARIERLRRKAERDAEQESKRAARERVRAEREAAQSLRILARDVERERVRAERAAAQEAKRRAAEQRAVEQAAADAARAAADAGRSLHRQLGIRPRNEILAEIERTQQAFRALRGAGGIPAGELRRLQGAYRAQLASLRAELERLPQTDMKPLSASIAGIGASALGTVASVGALAAGLKSVLDTTREFQALQKRFDYAFGGVAQGAAQMAFVRQEAERLGLEVLGAANGYAQLASATRDLNITQAQTQQIFTGVASAAAAMGLSTDDANGVFLALSQIAGKGKVSMEELRGQLGERLTPAMAIAAKSMGVTTAELEKMVESGLSAEVFLPKFGLALEEAFSAEAAKNAESLGGQINLLQNKFKEFLNELGEGGIADAAVSVMKEIGDAVDWARAKFADWDGGGAAGSALETLEGLYGLLKEAGGAAAALFSTVLETVNDLGDALGVLSGSAEGNFDVLKGVFDGLNIAIGAFRDGLAAVQIAWQGVAGALLEQLSLIMRGFAKLIPDMFGGDAFEAMADRLEQSARKHLGKAHELALGFKSKTAEAFAQAGESESQRLARVEQQARETYQGLSAEAVKAAETAKLAQERANAAIGTASEAAAAKQAQQSRKAAGEAAGAALKAESAWREAFAAIGGDAQTAAQVVKPLRDAGVAADAAAAEVKKVDKVLADAKGAAQGLGLDLRAAMNETTPAMKGVLDNITHLQTGFHKLAGSGADAAKLIDGAMAKALESAANEHDIAALREKYRELGQEGLLAGEAVERGLLAAQGRLLELQGGAGSVAEDFKALGIESSAAMRQLAREMEAAFEAVRRSGQASADVLHQALYKALGNAGNAEMLNVVRRQFRALGADGKLSMAQVEAGVNAVETRLQQLRGELDPVQAAFKKLGIESAESMRVQAQEMRQAFDVVKQNAALAGNTAEQSRERVAAAFERAAEAALASGDAASVAWVKAQAAAHGYAVAVDETGKVALKAAAQTERAAQAQADAHEQAAAGQSEHAAAAKQHTAETDKNTEAIERNTEAVGAQSTQLSEQWQHIQSRWYELVHHNKNVVSMSEGILRHMNNVARQSTGHWQAYVDKMFAVYDQAKAATEQLNAAADSGTDVMSRLAKAEAVAVSHARDLDKTSLANLQAEIDKARAKMQQLADEAKQTREDLQASLDELNGDNEAGARLAQERKLKDLAKKREAAAQSGNQDAQADYDRAIELQKQLYARQQQQKAEAEAQRRQQEAERAEQERQREAERQRQEQERQRKEAEREAERAERARERQRREAVREQANGSHRDWPEPDVRLNLNGDDFAAMLWQRDEQVAKMVVERLLKNLESAFKRGF